MCALHWTNMCSDTIHFAAAQPVLRHPPRRFVFVLATPARCRIRHGIDQYKMAAPPPHRFLAVAEVCCCCCFFVFVLVIKNQQGSTSTMALAVATTSAAICCFKPAAKAATMCGSHCRARAIRTGPCTMPRKTADFGQKVSHAADSSSAVCAPQCHTSLAAQWWTEPSLFPPSVAHGALLSHHTF